LNPLAVQAAQQNVDLARQRNPELIQQARQTSRTGQIALGVDEQKDVERRNMQTFFADPNNFQTNGRIDLDKINASVPKIAPLTGADYISKYSTLGEAQTKAISAKQNLTADQRSMIGQRFSILGRLGVQDKNVYLKEIELMKQENPDNPDLNRLLDSYKTIWQSEMNSGPDLPGKAIAGAQTLLTPAQQQTTLGPTISTQDGKTVITTPSVGGKAPAAEMGKVGGLQANVPTPGQPITGGPSAGGFGAQIAQGMRVPYPVRRADTPYIAEPTEIADQSAGVEYRNRLVNAQGTLSENRRNVEEVIKQANLINENLFAIEKGGGLIGKAGQKIRMAINSAEYEVLTKDLAKLALSNANALGGASNTVAGLDMQSVANGTIKMPPEKLIEIAQRVQADQTNLDLQAKGAQQFAQRFGDNNMKAYQQAWNANADSKIFEAMNIIKSEQDPAKLKKELDRLFPSKAKHDEFLNKYRNLKKLSETGTQ